MRTAITVLAGVALVCAGAPVAHADDAALIRAHDGAYRATELAAGRIGPPDGTQSAYEAARDLQEAVRAAAPVSRECRALLNGLSAYAAGRVLQAEGVDRPSAGDVSAGRARADSARARIASARGSCRGTGRGPAGGGTLAMSPAPGQAFFGAIVARAPAGATTAALHSGSGRVAQVRVRGGRARFVVSWKPGRYDIRVSFAAGSRSRGSVSAAGVWLLPASAQRARPGDRADAGLERALARALSGGPRYRAAWVQGVSSGRVARVNADARFPAASTVKLGLMAGVLPRLGGRPEESAYAYDLRAIAAWSSNLASNRLVRRFGNGVAVDGLRRLGTRVSTFTGDYIVGTEMQPRLPVGGIVSSPPLNTARVTSARDLAQMLFAIQASAVSRNARGHTGLTEHQARLMLGWLLGSQQRGDNVSLFGASIPGMPAAQKNGWLRSARLGAAIIYTASGPVIAVLAAQDDAGVPLSSAQTTGARVGRVALAAN